MIKHVKPRSHRIWKALRASDGDSPTDVLKHDVGDSFIINGRGMGDSLTADINGHDMGDSLSLNLNEPGMDDSLTTNING